MKFVDKLNLARAFVFNDLSKYVIIVQMNRQTCMIYKVMLFYISVPRSKIEPKPRCRKLKFFSLEMSAAFEFLCLEI